jgi:hypothetical protein
MLTGGFTAGAQMDGMKVSDFLSDVACSLESFLYIFGRRVIFAGYFSIAESPGATSPPLTASLPLSPTSFLYE